jgi:hypothetical protein
MEVEHITVSISINRCGMVFVFSLRLPYLPPSLPIIPISRLPWQLILYINLMVYD